jgi:hypothetical protein
MLARRLMGIRTRHVVHRLVQARLGEYTIAAIQAITLAERIGSRHAMPKAGSKLWQTIFGRQRFVQPPRGL